MKLFFLYIFFISNLGQAATIKFIYIFRIFRTQSCFGVDKLFNQRTDESLDVQGLGMNIFRMPEISNNLAKNTLKNGADLVS